MRRTIVAVFLCMVLGAACGGGKESSKKGASQTKSTKDRVSTTSTKRGSSSATDECESAEPTSASSGWRRHEAADGDYSLGYPAEWEDLTGQAELRAAEALTRETLDEAGIDPDLHIQYSLVRDPEGINVTVTEFPSVTTPLPVVRSRQLTRTRNLPAVSAATDEGLSWCIDGESAYGITIQFSGPREDNGEEADFYQQSWVVRHGTSLYLIQILSIDEQAVSLLNEIMRTWQWS